MMGTFLCLSKRNLKLYFKDKGAFFPSLITPVILLVLYATFLANVYNDSFVSAFPEGFMADEKIINAAVSGQLISSLLSVSCVTVAFCANLLMISDKANGIINDITVTPVRRSLIASSYFAASLASTLIITFTAMAICFVYLIFKGWFLSFSDVLCVVLDVLLLSLFGTSLSSCIHFFLSSNGQASAVATIISSGYGFICGAYMPISTFPEGLQKVLGFLPGTYGTALLKNHLLRGTFAEMESGGFPAEGVKEIKEAIGTDISFFGHNVDVETMYLVIIAAVILFTAIYVALNKIKRIKP